MEDTSRRWVRFVEQTLAPRGFDVTANERVFNAAGAPIAELDITIRGKLGERDFSWLIECRDRPSSGPAPSSWIEQLVGRRLRFGFDKVTAVSTTGFAEGAFEFASEQGIDLREVRSLAPEEFVDWLHIRALRQIERVSSLHRAVFVAGKRTQTQQVLQRSLAAQPGAKPFLRNGVTGEIFTASDAFVFATRQASDLFDGVEVNGPGRKVRLDVQYPPNARFVVDTDGGPIAVAKIGFWGEIAIRETNIPLTTTAVYRRAEPGGKISELAGFAPQWIHGHRVWFELHRIAESGETHVVMRRSPEGK